MKARRLIPWAVALLIAAGVYKWISDTLWQGHESDRTVLCASNLRQLGQAMVQYRAANGDRYPDSIASLLRTVPLPLTVIRGPSAHRYDSYDRKAPASERDAVDYQYLAAGLRGEQSTDVVLMVEPPNRHDSGWVMVLFGDGHVDSLLAVEHNSGKPRPWWTDLQEQIAAGKRPVIIPEKTR